MISTPICDFVREYAAKDPARLHMPGHKGKGPLGIEALDITEIDGAGSLYEAGGIIAGSEANASGLFGARTFYSAEGSSLAIRAMLCLALRGKKHPRVLAGRNAHRAFLSAAALLGFDVDWLHPKPGDAYHSCAVEPADIAAALDAGHYDAVYLTSPDYLGHVADVAGIAAECQKRRVPLLVDGAHGAYLKFLSPSRHPIDLGADMCCDSAHKTLPAITGGAYLHLRPGDPENRAAGAKSALALFGSSSPSWLVLQSLDACNRYLENYPARLAAFLPRLEALKGRLAARGFALIGDEPLKITVDAAAFGYSGDALAEALAEKNIFCEFHDPDFVTLMLTPENAADLPRLEEALLAIPRRDPAGAVPPAYHVPEAAMSVREAMLAVRETLPVRDCAGRVLADIAASCPPCVPVAMPGERIDAETVERLEYYGIHDCDVIK